MLELNHGVWQTLHSCGGNVAFIAVILSESPSKKIISKTVINVYFYIHIWPN